MKTLAIYVSLCLSLAGCASRPAEWANELGTKLRCGMSTSEVQELAKKPMEPLNREQATHLIRDGATDIWLTFEKGRLSSYQVAWVRPLTVVEKADRVILCQ